MPDRPASWDDLVRHEAEQQQVSPDLALAIFHQEHAPGTNALQSSPKGALGPMQLMPETAKRYGVDPNDPMQNIKGGVSHLKYLLGKYQGDVGKSAAAYNAGEVPVDANNGVPNFPETQQYVTSVLGALTKPKPAPTTGGPPQVGTPISSRTAATQMAPHPEAHIGPVTLGEQVRRSLPAIGGTLGFAAGLPFGPEALPLTTYLGGYAGKAAADVSRDLGFGPPMPTSTGTRLAGMHEAGTEQMGAAAAGEGLSAGSTTLTSKIGKLTGIPDALATPANREVVAANQQYGLNLSLPEQTTAKGVPSWGRSSQLLATRTVTGQKVAQGARQAGNANAAKAIGDELDRIGEEASRSTTGHDVQSGLRIGVGVQEGEHQADQALSRSAHETLQTQAQIRHEADQLRSLRTHQEAQRLLRGKHEEAQVLFAADDAAQKQAALDQAVTARQAVGKRMETASTGKNILVDTRPAKAEAQRIIDNELLPQTEYFPKKTPKQEAIGYGKPSSNTEWLAAITDEELSRMSPAARAQIELARQGQVDPLEAAKAIAKEHLQRVLNAPDQVPFEAAAQQRSAMLEASKYLKVSKTKAEGQVSRVAHTLGKEMSTINPEWGQASQDYAKAVEGVDTAEAAANTTFKSKVFKPTPFVAEKFKPTKYGQVPFKPDPRVASLLQQDPQSVVDALNSPARIVAARETLLQSAQRATDPVERAQATQAWDTLRTNVVREKLLKTNGKVDLDSFPEKFSKMDPDTLTALFPDHPQVVRTLGSIANALGRRDTLPSVRLATIWEMAAVTGALATGHPGAAASVIGVRESLPGLITWAMYKPEMAKLLTEGLSLKQTGQATAALLRVIQAYRSDREGVTGPPPQPRPSGGPPTPSTVRTSTASTSPVGGPPSPDMLRADGTRKGQGFFGPIQRPDGKVSSEISIGINIDGKEVEVPTLVPTLSAAEKQWLITNDVSDPKKIPSAIVEKAAAYARQRIAAGQSPFAP